MAENRTSSNISGNLGAGAGFLAKKFQKSMNRAQEKVMIQLLHFMNISQITHTRARTHADFRVVSSCVCLELISDLKV